MITTHRRKYRSRWNRKNQSIRIPIALFIGIIGGAILANAMNDVQYAKLATFMNNFLMSFGTSPMGKADIFIEDCVKYGKTLALIWSLGFVSFGAIFVYGILVAKGIGYGFTMAFIIRSYGLKGLLYGAALCVPQNIILIPVYFVAAYFSLAYMHNRARQAGSEKAGAFYFKEYIVLFCICCAFMLCAVLIEVFLTPGLMRHLKPV